MGTYRIGADGRLTEYQPQVLSDEHCEEEFKDWLEQNPQMLIDDEDVLWIGREVTTELGKSVDLLGLDKRGQILAVEVKAGTSPRTVIAQALEYGVWADGLDHEELSRIAEAYWARSKEEAEWIRGDDDEGICELAEGFKRYFAKEEDITIGRATVVYVVVVAQKVSEDVQAVAEWLRKHDIDIRCLEFTYYEGAEADERLITTQLVVGRVPTRDGRRPKLTRETFLDLFDDPEAREQVEELYDELKNVQQQYLGLCEISFGKASLMFRVRFRGQKPANVLYVSKYRVSATPWYLREGGVAEEVWQGYRDDLYTYQSPAPWQQPRATREHPETYMHYLLLTADTLSEYKEKIVNAVRTLAEELSTER